MLKIYKYLIQFIVYIKLWLWVSIISDGVNWELKALWSIDLVSQRRIISQFYDWKYYPNINYSVFVLCNIYSIYISKWTFINISIMPRGNDIDISSIYSTIFIFFTDNNSYYKYYHTNIWRMWSKIRFKTYGIHVTILWIRHIKINNIK